MSKQGSDHESPQKASNQSLKRLSTLTRNMLFSTQLEIQEQKGLDKVYCYLGDKAFDEQEANELLKSGLNFMKDIYLIYNIEGDSSPEELLNKCKICNRPYDARCPVFRNGR